jgi:hypothetical protein
MLAAQVGIQDDSSNRKFQNVLLSEFFGERRNDVENGSAATGTAATTTTTRTTALHQDTAAASKLGENMIKVIFNTEMTPTNLDTFYDDSKRVLIDIPSSSSVTDNDSLQERWWRMGLITNGINDNSGNSDWDYPRDGESWRILPGIVISLLTLGLATAIEKMCIRRIVGVN